MSWYQRLRLKLVPHIAIPKMLSLCEPPPSILGTYNYPPSSKFTAPLQRSSPEAPSIKNIKSHKHALLLDPGPRDPEPVQHILAPIKIQPWWLPHQVPFPGPLMKNSDKWKLTETKYDKQQQLMMNTDDLSLMTNINNKQQTRRLEVEEASLVTSRVFGAYGCPLNIVSPFKYLGRVLSVADGDWLAVFQNLAKDRMVWRRVSRNLSR